MAISPRAAANAAAKSSSTAAPVTQAATTGPYTLANAQAQWYTGGWSTPVAWAAPSINGNLWSGLSKTQVTPTTNTPKLSSSINIPTVWYQTTGTSNLSWDIAWAQKSWWAVYTPPVYAAPSTIKKNVAAATTPVAPAIKSAVQSYQNFFKTTGGDRAAYNASVWYDKLSTAQKRIADNVYNSTTSAEKKKKDEEDKKRAAVGNVSMTALEETPEQEKERLLKETAEATKKNAITAQEAALLQQNQAEQLNKAEADRAMAELNTEQTKYEWEQNETAAKTEETRLNQVRGDIMQSLASRWVDISKLAPEQLVALSGEQGVKAFNDIYVAKENAKTNIKNARDKSLAEIQRLRSNKTISTNAYNAQVTSINELTNTKLLEADNAYKNAVVGLIDKKVDTGAIIAKGVLNTLSTLGIPLSAQSAFKNIISNSKSEGEAYRAIMTSTDPAVQAAYKANEARIAEAAKQAYQLDLLKATPAAAKTPAEQWLEYIKAADSIQSYNPAQAEILRARWTQLLSWTSTGGQPSPAP